VVNIIIVGAGQVGTTLAEHLTAEDNDITIIDINAKCLNTLQERLDIRTIIGNGSYPNILLKAGAEVANMLIAVTNSDEINMLACQIAHSLFKIETKIARIRALQYLTYPKLFESNAIPIDVLISPEQLVTTHIRRLIEYPDALQVLDFANSKAQLVVILTQSGASCVGHSLEFFFERITPIQCYIPVIFRDEKPFFPALDFIIEANDEIFFLSEPAHIRIIISEFRTLAPLNKRVMIAGGGNIGSRVAESLDTHFKVKIIEKDSSRVEFLATILSNSVVLMGDAADKDLLLNENIENMDVFCATTNHDETNIMSALLAKRLGAHRVMALINRNAYVDIIEGGPIDRIISPQQTTIGGLLAHIRGGDIENIYTLHKGEIEIIEFIINAETENTKILSCTLHELPLPANTVITGIIRNNEVLFPNNTLALMRHDRVILIILDKRRINELERLFQTEFKI